MNKQFFREVKSLNIRDCKNDPRHRQAMGLFKHLAYKNNLSQAELLTRIMNKIYRIDNE